MSPILVLSRANFLLLNIVSQQRRLHTVPWLEMSRDPVHGGPGWDFGTSLWSPTERRGGGRWGYWDLMQRVREGDVVIHLRGNAAPEFVGHSVADADCYTTTDRPPDPGTWDHAEVFYRVPLRDYCPLEQPVSLSSVFETKCEELERYHTSHSPVSNANGRFLFFVPQAGRLQCQNGAYLSEVDSDLGQLLFGVTGGSTPPASDVTTGSGLSTMQTRVGQKAFSDAVRDNFEHRCCFPNCGVSDPRFIIGAHIARWSDAVDYRGKVSNGLCLCLMHDKAFETGLFVVSADLFVVPTSIASESDWGVAHILPFTGQQIKMPTVKPSLDCLSQHWARVGYVPEQAG